MVFNAGTPQRPASPPSIPTRADATTDILRSGTGSPGGVRSFVNTSATGITTRKAAGRRSFLGGS